MANDANNAAKKSNPKMDIIGMVAPKMKSINADDPNGVVLNMIAWFSGG